MVWFLVDDVLPFHERVLRAGNAAMGLWVRAGSWSAGQLTDGFVPADVARTMGSAAEIRSLVRVGLWKPAEKDSEHGFTIHAWGQDGTGQKRQPTKAEVEERRRKEREKKARQRAQQQHDDEGRFAPVSPRVSPGDTLGESHRSKPGQTVPPLLAALEGGAPPVDNSGDDIEPQLRCPAHLGVTRPPRCGACKDARLEHEAWEQRTPAIPPAPIRRPSSWDVATHCEHGQIRGDCETCAYESSRAGTLIRGPWEAPGCDAAGTRNPGVS